MLDKTAVIKEAQKFLARGQLDKALAEWDKILKEFPDGNTFNIVGDLYLKKGDRKNAVDSFHKSAKFFRDEGFALKALALYKKVLNINPTDAAALYALGELSEEKGLATDAIKYYLATADSYSKDGKKDNLLEIYRKILSLSPSNIPLKNKISETLLKEGLISEAVNEYVGIAHLYEEKGDYQKAGEFYKKVVELQPLNKEATLGLAGLYEKSGDMDGAVRSLKEASVLFHREPDVLFKYAELLLRTGNAPAAKEMLGKVLEIEPSSLSPRRLLGDILMKEGLLEEAWTEYLPVIDEMLLAEQYAEAASLLEHFREINPFEVCKRLVSLYRQMGDQDKTAEELVYLGDRLIERDMKEEALGCYQDALDINPDNTMLKQMIEELSAKPAPPTEFEFETHEEHHEETPEETKTAEEIFIETDIFMRYGLQKEAIKLLESLKMREPQNLELHSRLKTIYTDAGDPESAVTECLILSELYKRQGDPDRSEEMLKEALRTNPEDPRLAQRGITKDSYEFAEKPAAPESVIEDFEEELSEADFYARQGLIVEASKILERLHGMFPENTDILEKLNNLGQPTNFSMPEEFEWQASQSEQAEGSAAQPQDITGEIPAEQQLKEPSEFEDFMLTEQDLVEAQEMPEPSLDSDVLEIFHEFKKGLEKELGDEDSETHYNLGIAYKEMGLIDDAIKEFQTSRNDPKRFLQSASMLGVCYMEKGLYPLAIEALSGALKEHAGKDEAYWSLTYDLAEAHEKNGGLKEALSLYTDVYGWNAKFRAVAEKISLLRASGATPVEKEKPKERKDRVSYL